ncbi:hypothetical protein V5029_16030 [Enterobacter hormaechei]|uniref:hypothetical protein n=1 Tax=Enterobacter hormaechei TaxID=158836 RepID=UPI0030765FA0
MSTITREFTKEQLQQIIETDHVQCGEASSLARIALASLEVEAVAYADPQSFDNFKSMGGKNAACTKEWMWRDSGDGLIPVYTAPPAPVSVPDLLEQFAEFMAAESIKSGDYPDGWQSKASNAAHEYAQNIRAAMLQGADGTLTNEGTIPVTQFKPVADLYGLTSPTGGETSFTFDAVEARDFIDGGWSCQEYVELGRFQEAVSGNSPVIPDGWVAVPVEPTIAILDEFDSIIDYGAEDSKDAWSRLLAAAWIKSLPAAPQQEVK